MNRRPFNELLQIIWIIFMMIAAIVAAGIAVEKLIDLIN